MQYCGIYLHMAQPYPVSMTRVSQVISHKQLDFSEPEIDYEPWLESFCDSTLTWLNPIHDMPWLKRTGWLYVSRLQSSKVIVTTCIVWLVLLRIRLISMLQCSVRSKISQNGIIYTWQIFIAKWGYNDHSLPGAENSVVAHSWKRRRQLKIISKKLKINSSPPTLVQQNFNLGIFKHDVT